MVGKNSKRCLSRDDENEERKTAIMPQNYINVLKRQEYVSHMRPVFNKRGVFSDETEQYRTPFQPKAGDDVKIRIRTLKNNVDRKSVV